MKLNLLLLFSLFLYIIIPNVFIPAIFLGILAFYIINRQYFLTIIWLFIIIAVLQSFSLTQWWEFAGYYSFWSLGVYFSSIFLDKSWAVQSIIISLWLFLSKFIFNSFTVDYLNITVYALMNAFSISIFLYFAEKLKLYEEFI